MLYMVAVGLLVVGVIILICAVSQTDKLGKFYLVVLILLSLLLTLGLGHGLGFKKGQIEYAKGNIQFERTTVDKWVEVEE